ncbi:hypothetical protein LguiB_016693 [Lonicera macranthoides]
MLNARSEAYSFGILIMEIISGRNQFIIVTRQKRHVRPQLKYVRATDSEHTVNTSPNSSDIDLYGTSV